MVGTSAEMLRYVLIRWVERDLKRLGSPNHKKMDKFTWRFSDRLPGSIQATLLFVSLMLVLSVVSFEMLSESTWEGNFGTLLMGVSSFVINLENTTIVELAPPPFAENYPIFAEPHAAPPTAQDLAIPAPAVESGNYSVISSSAEVPTDSNSFSTVSIAPQPSVSVRLTCTSL